MRLLVLVLAIVLLPLRGWLGDAMMLAPVQQGPVGHAMHAMPSFDHDGHSGHGVHASHAVTNADAMHDETESPHAAHTTCDTCQFCHSVAVTAWPEVPMPAAAPSHAPIAGAMQFASTEAVRGFKPPIS